MSCGGDGDVRAELKMPSSKRDDATTQRSLDALSNSDVSRWSGAAWDEDGRVAGTTMNEVARGTRDVGDTSETRGDGRARI
eukprot:CAMPEP_0175841390 /NCGR_PEP_ID=MMETSP0107_2-20121207/19910_1 /TAXON_ID=195067 ORGANISM="Goniomonas pacifica, Strain CCMP1869" /NCGR_SAMPLE_ID=MMETSP0107_2 /ASSEMBLY_ACC=CAM_ASM_000203 /LENGTH=80 /DNA_ID=CAMNT_0017155367 /DNA_START=221 /DNA_END=463 /DNA_ORIENTATION=+